MKKLFLGVLIAAALCAPVDGAEEKGWFGFKVAAKTSGFMLNPTITSVTVEQVIPNSPAAQQQISVGDEIIEAEGKTVPGGKARELKPIMAKAPGEVLQLRLKRKSGETYSAKLKATKRPS